VNSSKFNAPKYFLLCECCFYKGSSGTCVNEGVKVYAGLNPAFGTIKIVVISGG
jgi:hypothetical protein